MDRQIKIVYILNKEKNMRIQGKCDVSVNASIDH